MEILETEDKKATDYVKVPEELREHLMNMHNQKTEKKNDEFGEALQKELKVISSQESKDDDLSTEIRMKQSKYAAKYVPVKKQALDEFSLSKMAEYDEE